MQNKTINKLTSLENPRLTDTLPIWDGTEGKTKKVSLAKIPANVITPVDSLPESPNILDRVYRYNNKYYVGNESAQTLTELASKADIPTVVDTVENGNMNPVTSNAVYDRLAYSVIPTGVSIDELIGPSYVGTYKVTQSTYMPYVCGNQLSSGTLVITFDGTSTIQTILGNGFTARRVHNGTSWKNYSTSNNDNLSVEQYPYGWRVTYGQSYNKDYLFHDMWNSVKCYLSIANGIPVIHLLGSNNTPDMVENGNVVFPRESLANALWRFGMNPTSFARWYWTCSGTFDHGNVQLYGANYSSYTNAFHLRSNSSLSGTSVNVCFFPWFIN